MVIVNSPIWNVIRIASPPFGKCGQPPAVVVQRLAAEAAQADEKSWADQVDDPDFVFAWWMIAVALGTFALGGGIVLLSLHSAARRRKKYTGKFVRK